MIPRFDRADALRRLRADDFDVLVVGGGITGAGVALDAAARGLRTALVERDDFASGASSKSSKLVHGGLRYLREGDVRLVYEGLYERARALENAPHLVRLLPFLVPVLRRGGFVDRRLERAAGSALWAYDLAGGVRVGRRHEWISVPEASGYVPTLDSDALAGAYLLYDAQVDDARLTLTVVRTAAAYGAAVANYARVVGILESRARVVGARIDTGQGEIEVRARCVVNAAGVWSDDVRALDEGTHPASLRPAKGVHLTVPWDRVRNRVAVMLPVAGDDRTVFVVPWGDFTYVGTTDTEYDGPLDDPVCTAADATYLLDAVNRFLRDPLTQADVTGSWAGLRPLLRTGHGHRAARTADLSRRHAVRTSPAGTVTITGGKLTTYRRMATDAVDAAVRELGNGIPASPTRHLRLLGADISTPPYVPAAAAPEHLEGRYGSEAGALRSLVARDGSLGQQLVPGLPYLRAEAVHAVRHEMARTLGDVLERRTRARVLARAASAAAAADVATLLAPELGWSDREREAEVAAYRASVAAEARELAR